MKLILAWLFVVVALGWGVQKSVRKAAPLFQAKSSILQPPPPVEAVPQVPNH